MQRCCQLYKRTVHTHTHTPTHIHNTQHTCTAFSVTLLKTHKDHVSFADAHRKKARRLVRVLCTSQNAREAEMATASAFGVVVVVVFRSCCVAAEFASARQTVPSMSVRAMHALGKSFVFVKNIENNKDIGFNLIL